MPNLKNDTPLILVMNEAEDKLTTTINDMLSDYHLPCYLLEMIVDKIHRQLKDVAKNELVTAKNEYARKCAKTTLEEGTV